MSTPASGDADSPIANRGCRPRSSSATRYPSRRAIIARIDPANPDPTIAMSVASAETTLARQSTLVNYAVVERQVDVRQLALIFGLALVATVAMAQTSSVHLPDEAAGVDQVVQALVSVFDQADILALGEDHNRKA